jgi:hypothetical protein
MPSTNVTILNKCDSHPSPFGDPKGYSEALSNYTLFQVNGVTIGYLLVPVVATLRSAKWEDWNVGATTVEFAPEHDSFEKRSAVMKATLDLWRKEKRFKVLEGWSHRVTDFRLAERVVSSLRSKWRGFVCDGTECDAVVWCGYVRGAYDGVYSADTVSAHANLDTKTIRAETDVSRHAR